VSTPSKLVRELRICLGELPAALNRKYLQLLYSVGLGRDENKKEAGAENYFGAHFMTVIR